MNKNIILLESHYILVYAPNIKFKDDSTHASSGNVIWINTSGVGGNLSYIINFLGDIIWLSTDVPVVIIERCQRNCTFKGCGRN